MAVLALAAVLGACGGVARSLVAYAFEPWTFVIDRTGRISHRFDNVAGEDELQAAVDQVTR